LLDFEKKVGITMVMGRIGKGWNMSYPNCFAQVVRVRGRRILVAPRQDATNPSQTIEKKNRRTW
jgi:hypothetical protein